MSTPPGRRSCPMCGAPGLRVRFRWTEPPVGETRFELPDGVVYDREFLECGTCGHLLADPGIDPDVIYGGAYVDATYTDGGMERAYDRIMSLPPGSSDNIERVERVCAQMAANAPAARRVLDIGSGLGVFGARMKEQGWSVTVLDPDPRAVAHARERIGVEGIEADFMELELGRTYELLTLNKVLEHVADPLAMLRRAADHLDPGAWVYVEVPDGEVAAAHGDGREELFIEHLHAFSLASLGLLAQRAGFRIERIERLHEPSDKFTLAAFLHQAPGPLPGL